MSTVLIDLDPELFRSVRTRGGARGWGIVRRGWGIVRRVLPGVALALAVAAVAFGAWPRSFGGPVSYVKVSGTSMAPRLHTGDLVVMRSHPGYRRGEVIAYRIPAGEFGAGHVVVHRIVGGDGTRGFVTRGDNRTVADPWHPRTGDVLGSEWFPLARAGVVLDFLRAPVRVGLLCGWITFLAVAWGVWREPAAGRRPPARDPRDELLASWPPLG